MNSRDGLEISAIPFPVFGPGAEVLTRCLNIATKPDASICGRCRGTKFDSFERSRSSRKCPHCKGTGRVRVGGTKR